MYVNATCPPVPYTMASYMAELAELFRGHEVLRDYAASLGARIVNHTRTSMIDALRTGCGRPALNMTHGREFSARDFYS